MSLRYRLQGVELHRQLHYEIHFECLKIANNARCKEVKIKKNSTTAKLICDVVQFIIQVNSQVLVRCHHLNVCFQDVCTCMQGCLNLWKYTTSSLCLPCIKLEMVWLAPVFEVLNKFYVGSVVPIPDEADDSRVVRELL